MLVSTVVPGLILLVKPFKIEGWSLMRDLFFFVITISIFFISFYTGRMTVTIGFSK